MSQPPENMDELFPSSASSAPKRVTYVCTSCKDRFTTDRLVRFCSRCGSPVRPAEQLDRCVVLLADDSALAHKKISAILQQLNCEVLAAYNGKEALKIAAGKVPDLIVLDVEMPEMSGLEALKLLRKVPRLAKIPVLMLTVQSDPQTVSEALAGQVRDYIRKDAPVTQIEDRLRRQIERLHDL